MKKAVILLALLLLGLCVASCLGEEKAKMATLFANMEVSAAADITAFLQENKYDYKLDNDGRTILVPKEILYKVRISLAMNGLPKLRNKSYELFDKNQLGMTDFAQNLNYRRAVEAELSRSIETFSEVEQAKVNVNIPKQTLFEDKKGDASASVIIKLRSGGNLDERQIKSIQHLVASAIDGLKARQVTVLDDSRNMLTKGYADNAVAKHTDHDMELRRSTEERLKRQVLKMLDGVLGPNKATVEVSADLDFDQKSRTTENPGTIKRLTVLVLVDGTYDHDSVSKQKIYRPRSEEDLAIFTSMVKNVVGYSQERNDSVYVASMRFESLDYWEKESAKMEQEAVSQPSIVIFKPFIIPLLLVIGIIMVIFFVLIIVFTSSKWTVLFYLSFFLGWWAIDRFYVGKIGSGILKLLTAGGFGIWWLIDLLVIAGGKFTDASGAFVEKQGSAVKHICICIGISLSPIILIIIMFMLQ